MHRFDVRRLFLASAALAVMAALTGCGGSETAPTTVQVTINSEPEQGAEVLVAGIQAGLSPAVIALEPGYADVLLKKEGYKLASDRIQVVAGAPMEFTLALRPLVGYITFESVPVGAKIMLNGTQDLGVTPLYNVEVPVGSHSYEVTYENHHPESKSIEVQEDFRYRYNHELRAMKATISLTSRPSGATVFINGKQQIETTPAKFELTPGTFVISVYATGYVQAEEKIVLAPNESRDLSLTMNAGDVPPGMVLVPAGEFSMGADGRAPDESPMRKVQVEAFYIDKTEVTNAQYKALIPEHVFPKGQEDFPVSNVSWNEAIKYASLAGKRLPTEMEWEKAARGVEGFEYPWGNEFASEFANMEDPNTGATESVGKYIEGMSPFGCMDMAGNVYEWTQNWYEAYPGNTQVTKEYGQIYRSLRGGSYASDRFDVRSARRRFDKMDAKAPDYGFRCVISATP